MAKIVSQVVANANQRAQWRICFTGLDVAGRNMNEAARAAAVTSAFFKHVFEPRPLKRPSDNVRRGAFGPADCKAIDCVLAFLHLQYRSFLMKQLFLLSVISASLAGCATPAPNAAANPASSQEAATSQDGTGVPIDPTYRTPRTSIGVGIGSFGGRGFGGVGIGLGF
jgi:hypothetical protein